MRAREYATKGYIYTPRAPDSFWKMNQGRRGRYKERNGEPFVHNTLAAAHCMSGASKCRIFNRYNCCLHLQCRRLRRCEVVPAIGRGAADFDRSVV